MKKALPWILAFLLVLISLLTSFLVQYLLIEFSILGKKSGFDFSKLSSKQFFYLIASQAIPFLFWGIIFVRFLGFKIFPFQLDFTFKEFLFAFLGLFFVNGFTAFILHLLGQEVKQFEELNKELLKREPVPFFIAVGLLAPFYEEFVFRGILFAYLVEKSKNIFTKFLAWIYPAFLFSLLHLENAKNSFILLPIFTLAIYLTALTHFKKNIGLSVSIHAAQNFLAGVVFLYFPEV